MVSESRHLFQPPFLVSSVALGFILEQLNAAGSQEDAGSRGREGDELKMRLRDLAVQGDQKSRVLLYIQKAFMQKKLRAFAD